MTPTLHHNYSDPEIATLARRSQKKDFSEVWMAINYSINEARFENNTGGVSIFAW